jgi:hypothetical protein
MLTLSVALFVAGVLALVTVPVRRVPATARGLPVSTALVSVPLMRVVTALS